MHTLVLHTVHHTMECLGPLGLHLRPRHMAFARSLRPGQPWWGYEVEHPDQCSGDLRSTHVPSHHAQIQAFCSLPSAESWEQYMNSSAMGGPPFALDAFGCFWHPHVHDRTPYRTIVLSSTNNTCMCNAHRVTLAPCITLSLNLSGCKYTSLSVSFKAATKHPCKFWREPNAPRTLQPYITAGHVGSSSFAAAQVFGLEIPGDPVGCAFASKYVKIGGSERDPKWMKRPENSGVNFTDSCDSTRRE